MDRSVRRRATQDPLNITIGRRIRAGRRLRDLSRDALARSLGISCQRLQSYEHGRARIGASTLHRVACALDLPFAAFFDEAVSRRDPDRASMAVFDHLPPRVRQAALALIDDLSADGAAFSAVLGTSSETCEETASP